MIKTLDRHIYKIFFYYYGLSLTVMTSLFLLIDVVTTLNRFQVSGKVYLGYYLNYLPWIISQMMPVAGVMATVFLFVNLQKFQELIVFHSLGYSIYRILRPVIFSLLILSVLCWVIVDIWVPRAMEKRNYYYYVEMKKNPSRYNKLKKENVWFRTPEAIINIGKSESETQASNLKVIFYDKTNWIPLRMIEAESVFFFENEWVFKKGQESFFDEEGKNVKVAPFTEVKTHALEQLSEFKKTSNIAALSLSELAKASKKAKEAGMLYRNYETEFHGKLSFIFSALFLSLLAVPLCIGHARSSNIFVGIGLSIFIALVYWVVYSTVLSMGKTGLLPPIVAAWSPGVVSLFAFYVLMKLRASY